MSVGWVEEQTSCLDRAAGYMIETESRNRLVTPTKTLCLDGRCFFSSLCQLTLESRSTLFDLSADEENADWLSVT